jgi:hypothetical protein
MERYWNIYRVFAGQIGLVEIVHICHVSPSKATLKGDGRIRPYEHGDGSSTTCGTSSPFGIHSAVCSDNNGIATIPSTALHPVQTVLQGRCAAIAGVRRINSLNIPIA